VQVDNSQERHGDYLELKMTGSLYGIRNVYKALAGDDEWFTLRVTVRKPRVEIRVNDTLVVDWIEPPGPLPEGAPKMNRLGRGTFALQCHDPESKVFYRNIRVKPLPAPPAIAAPLPLLDARYAQVLALGRANFPLVDLHAHLKGVSRSGRPSPSRGAPGCSSAWPSTAARGSPSRRTPTRWRGSTP